MDAGSAPQTFYRCARYFHAYVSAIIQRLDAGQHLAMNALALQRGLQQLVLYAIIGLLDVYKSCKQGLLLRFGPVNEMAQGEQLVLCGEAWTKASLAGIVRKRREIFSSMAANKADRAVLLECECSERMQSLSW